MARTAYKKLYLHQLQAAGEEKDRANRAEKELARISAILSAHGEKFLSTIPKDSSGDLPLRPLEFEFVRAFYTMHMRSFQRFSDTIDVPTSYMWRARRIVEVP